MKHHLHRTAEYLHLRLLGVDSPPGFFSAVSSLVLLISAGTIFYMMVEDWSAVDALYFTVVTITTVGYGDLHPTTALSKLFTVVLLFAGIGLGIFVVTAIAESLRKGREKRLERIHSLIRTSKKPVN